MAEISINVEKLEENIKKMKELLTQSKSIEAKEQVVVGSGQTIEILKKIDLEYKELCGNVNTLINSSIEFFEGVKESISETDRIIADHM